MPGFRFFPTLVAVVLLSSPARAIECHPAGGINDEVLRLVAPSAQAVGQVEIPARSLLRSPLWGPNRTQIELLLREKQLHPEQLNWIGVVPGASESWGHHCAPPRRLDPDRTQVSPEFRARLDRSFRLLQSGAVRFLLVSGGPIDHERIDYVEAERGKQYLIRTYGAAWVGNLADRIMIDPLAETTPANIRNADKLSQDLGLSRSLVITTMPRSDSALPGIIPGYQANRQGYYFLHSTISTYDRRARRDIGYELGNYSWFETKDTGDHRISAVQHEIDADESRGLEADQYGTGLERLPPPDPEDCVR